MTTRFDRAYGVGLAYRPEMHRAILDGAAEIDLVEIPTEDYIIRGRKLVNDPHGRVLREVMGRLPAVAHGIHISLGSVEPHDRPTLDRTVALLQEHGLAHFSEHLAYQRMDGTDLQMFQCLPFEESAAQWVAAKYHQVRARLPEPMGLENVSYYSPVPHSPLDEAAFLTRVTELTDCTLLLDVTNVYNNAVNHGYDAVEFIRRLPGDRVEQLHLAGGHYSNGILQDSHSQPVMPPVWDLLHEVLEQTAAQCVILERDSNFEPFENVMKDVRHAREIFRQHRPSTPPAESGHNGRASRSPLSADDADRRVEQLLSDCEVRQLGGFQSATVAAITDPQVRRLWADSPEAVAERFGLDRRWTERWLACDRSRLELLQRKWGHIESETRQEQEMFAIYEWQAWAKQNAG